MTTEEAIKIGDLIIDEETGEILEMPSGIGEPIAWLTHKANEAKAASKAWVALDGMYRQAIGKLLIDAGVRAMQTDYGKPGWRSRVDWKARIERLPEIARQFELSNHQIQAILNCAKDLDVKRLKALDSIPDEVKVALIESKESAWVQISPLTPMPPDVERVPRKEADGGDGE